MKKVAGLLIFSILILCACVHQHTWIEATCTTPMTCTECGETEGDALGHKWIEATCTNPKTCSICGKTEGVAQGHTWTEATCTEPRTCTVCGKTGEDALGHDWQEATCTEPKTCRVCGETEGKALGHSWVEATYTSPKSCSRCLTTEGSPKKSFFEKNNFPVNDKLRGFTAKAAIALDRFENPKRTEQISVKYSVKTYTIIPSNTRANYKTVAIIIEAPLKITNYRGAYISIGELVDYYTGYRFAYRSTMNDETISMFDSVNVDGKKYTLYYAFDIEWEDTKEADIATLTFVIDIPNDYDGLVLRFTDKNVDAFYKEDDYDFNSGYLDSKDEKGYNFRIGND